MKDERAKDRKSDILKSLLSTKLFSESNGINDGRKQNNYSSLAASAAFDLILNKVMTDHDSNLSTGLG
jgi:hypothetical protein